MKENRERNVRDFNLIFKSVDTLIEKSEIIVPFCEKHFLSKYEADGLIQANKGESLNQERVILVK